MTRLLRYVVAAAAGFVAGGLLDAYLVAGAEDAAYRKGYREGFRSYLFWEDPRS